MTNAGTEPADRSALVVPCPELAVFTVTGADRLSWLNGMLTCELAGSKPGDAVYGLQVGLKGRIVSDVILVVVEERVLLLVQRSAIEAETALLERHLMMEDALVEPAFDAYSVFLSHGPRSGEVLEAARRAGAVGGMLDLTGLGGAVIVAPAASGDVLAAIEAALARVGGALGDASAWEELRVARNVPRFGVDFDSESYPQEAGLEKTAVSFSKGCYLGQEVVCMLELRGHVKRKLVPLLLAPGDRGERIAKGASVTDDAGAPVGEVTSAAWMDREERWRALAMLKYAQAKAGGKVHVGARIADIVPA